MFASLSARVAALGLMVVAALIGLAGLLADTAYQTRESFRWTTHSAVVMEATLAALGAVREAESGQRGFIITHDATYARFFDQRVGEATRYIGYVVGLTVDNPLQHGRAREIAALMRRRLSVLRGPLDLGQRGDFTGAGTAIVANHGLELMDEIAERTHDFLIEEHRLETTRGEAAEERLARGRWLALVGAPAVALLVIAALALLVRRIRGPLATIIRAMTDLGAGARGARITDAMRSEEFSRLAEGYNAMAERLERAVDGHAGSERQLQVANAELKRNGEALRERGAVIELLGGMAHRMQAARTDDELAAVIRVFVPRVLPGLAGALYAHNNSRNLLVPVAGWGGIEVAPEGGFAPDQCWALRRGRSHCVTGPGADIVCPHAEADEVYHCEPLLAGGEVIGVLYLRGLVEAETRFRLTSLTENIASALVNHRLQRSLREQTIRDPLTGLFNRRYMEETLALEIARAGRAGTSLGVVMCDVDHFKRFNDEFGHDAGDAVLQAVSAEMRARFREGDVVCRYGGEEFTVIAPGTGAEALLERVEHVRRAIGEVTVRQAGRALGSVSMSFGVATWAPGMARDGSTLVQAADAALYQAKRDGRNRARLAQLAA